MSAIVQAFKDADLRKKIIFTIVMIIAYRVGAQIPSPGVDYASIAGRLRQLTEQSGDLYSVINLFSGGALLQLHNNRRRNVRHDADGEDAEFKPHSDNLPWCMIPEKKKRFFAYIS